MNDASQPKTLTEAVRYFADLDVCHAYMAKLKWPDGVVKCPKCGGENVGLITTRRMFKCRAKECRKQFSVKVGTIFEDSPLPLDKWFVAVWSITNAKNGISSCELARALGVTQKSAWHMLHRVRLALKAQSFDKLTGEVESDESFIGGRAKNMHKAKREKLPYTRGFGGKAIVHGLIERGDKNRISKVRAKVVKDTKAKTLLPVIISNVEQGTNVYTDALQSYKDLAAFDYVHEAIDHAEAYVKGRCHTNGLENFWSLFKRAINGTYVSVDVQHLERYCDEQVWRFNERKLTDGQRFNVAMPGVVGKQLTYAELIGAEAPVGYSSGENAGDAEKVN